MKVKQASLHHFLEEKKKKALNQQLTLISCSVMETHMHTFTLQ